MMVFVCAFVVRFNLHHGRTGALAVGALRELTWGCRQAAQGQQFISCHRAPCMMGSRMHLHFEAMEFIVIVSVSIEICTAGVYGSMFHSPLWLVGLDS
jgi:hypothetical protein